MIQKYVNKQVNNQLPILVLLYPNHILNEHLRHRIRAFTTQNTSFYDVVYEHLRRSIRAFTTNYDVAYEHLRSRIQSFTTNYDVAYEQLRRCIRAIMTSHTSIYDITYEYLRRCSCTSQYRVKPCNIRPFTIAYFVVSDCLRHFIQPGYFFSTQSTNTLS